MPRVWALNPEIRIDLLITICPIHALKGPYKASGPILGAHTCNLRRMRRCRVGTPFDMAPRTIAAHFCRSSCCQPIFIQQNVDSASQRQRLTESDQTASTFVGSMSNKLLLTTTGIMNRSLAGLRPAESDNEVPGLSRPRSLEA